MKHEGSKRYNIWWGPPKKFSTIIEERKISWLELFYDLVYVIVISRTTHHLAMNPGVDGIVDYFLLFIMIFWGWYNGSMYHDLHGSTGIRTRFMTLWQMLAVAALAVTLNISKDVFAVKTLIALLFLQGYVTYLWWSVGIYDKNHRKLGKPYFYCYLSSVALICATIFVPLPYKRICIGIALCFNYLPPFFIAPVFGRRHLDLKLSSSMVERLGLLTIIVFGEVILGLINGMGEVVQLDAHAWICFAMGILVVFALWWIFFGLIADREIQEGFIKGQVMSMLYIPTLASLGIMGATFPGLMKTLNVMPPDENISILKMLFGASLGIFLISILAISYYLHYPEEYNNGKKIIRRSIQAAAIGIVLLTFFMKDFSLLYYLTGIFIILLVIIVILARVWFKIELKRIISEEKT